MLVRTGVNLTAIDLRSGRRRWIRSNVDGATVANGLAILSQGGHLIALRAVDGRQKWNVDCGRIPFVLGVGGRIVTQCGGRSTVVNASDGTVTASSAIPEGRYVGAGTISPDYAAVYDIFEGAMMGTITRVVNLRTGAYVWGAADVGIVRSTADTVDLVDVPSVSPGASGEHLTRYALADGHVLSTTTFFPPETDDHGGYVAFSDAATYVTRTDHTIYRYLGRTVTSPQLVANAAAPFRIDPPVLTLGASAFIAVAARAAGPPDPARPPKYLRDYVMMSVDVFLDRPGSGGSFHLTPLGRFVVGMNGEQTDTPYERFGERVLLIGRNAVWAYDARGRLDFAIPTSCRRAAVVLSEVTALTLCVEYGKPAMMHAFDIATLRKVQFSYSAL